MQPEDILRLRETDNIVKQHKIVDEQERLVAHVHKLIKIRTKKASIDTINLLNRLVKILEN